jgi:hypothetical protein
MTQPFQSLSRRALLGAATSAVVLLAMPVRAQNAEVDQMKIGPEHFFLTLDETKGTVLVDLLSFKSVVAGVAASDRPNFAMALGRKVAKLVLDELEAADAKKLANLAIEFVYVNQRDEYQKPRPGGLQRLGAVDASIANGAVAGVAVNGNLNF